MKHLKARPGAENFRILAPLSRGWKGTRIRQADVERLLYARYRVTVAVPSLPRPRTETRILEGWQLHDYMRLHAGELAEFIVGVEPIARRVQTSAER